MTASFKGKNPVTWLQAKSPLSFVFSSAFIQELTKSLLEVCFGYFTTLRPHLRDAHTSYDFLQPPFCF